MAIRVVQGCIEIQMCAYLSHSLRACWSQKSALPRVRRPTSGERVGITPFCETMTTIAHGRCGLEEV
jgi:hypothetical protein